MSFHCPLSLFPSLLHALWRQTSGKVLSILQHILIISPSRVSSYSLSFKHICPETLIKTFKVLGQTCAESAITIGE